MTHILALAVKIWRGMLCRPVGMTCRPAELLSLLGYLCVDGSIHTCRGLGLWADLCELPFLVLKPLSLLLRWCKQGYKVKELAWLKRISQVRKNCCNGCTVLHFATPGKGGILREGEGVAGTFCALFLAVECPLTSHSSQALRLF